jgi:uncharacterized protein (DUF433 family)
MTDEDRLITQYIELDPDRSGLDRARLKEEGVEVWAFVAYWQAVNHDIARMAMDYQVAPEAVEAALAYYRRRRTLLDARIAINNGEILDILQAT